MKRMFFALCAVAGLGGCAALETLEAPHRAPVGSFSFSIDGTTDAVGVMSVQQKEGRAFVCGTRYMKGQLRELASRLFADYQIYSGDTLLVPGTRYFRIVRDTDDLTSTNATCRDSGVAWQTSFGRVRPRAEVNRTTSRVRWQ